MSYPAGSLISSIHVDQRVAPGERGDPHPGLAHLDLDRLLAAWTRVCAQDLRLGAVLQIVPRREPDRRAAVVHLLGDLAPRDDDALADADRVGHFISLIHQFAGTFTFPIGSVHIAG